jgi:formate-dependent phosphoribosylglycinamide formyltransferase (GAR transformylase)
MPHVVLVAPHFLENTNRYVNAFAALDGVTLSLVSEDAASAIPENLRAKIAGHYKVDQCLDGAALTAAVRWIGGAFGRVDRLTGVLEQLQIPMAEARDALDIDGIRTAVARNFRDKDRMKEVLRGHDVPVARSALTSSTAELRAFVERVGFPVIVKPQAGLGARATYRITSEEELTALARQGVMPSAARPLQAEEFVQAREHTCETVTVRGVPVWRSGTRYFPSPLEVLETPWVQYCVLLPREDTDTEWTRFHPTNDAALAALFGSAAPTAAGTALTHMEWFLREDGTSLVNEVGVRPPGVGIMPLMSIAHEASFIDLWAELVTFDRFTPLVRRWAAGAAFLRGQGSGDRIVQVDGIDEAIAAAGDALVELRVPKVGQPRADGYEGEGFATVRHATTEGVKQALLGLIERVQVRYGP